ncbi:PaeR7I family type II restriction endonuclease [Pararhodospirillum oryzae]|uniref:Type-2 restriction enzyme n=1 Tax=Pararhodospirillum oryzae TaxID=478448 RepID=A0A512H586_9PROT|nr:PaeR7I family type II restriction endonuclease [Pararhodospirillum oryzae]GEO80639.1 type-2 restriction enzyme [Pararhodospirillum oryzae]
MTVPPESPLLFPDLPLFAPSPAPGPLAPETLNALARDAVRTFWQTRDQARQRQQAGASPDQGERAGVTAGKNMDGFTALVSALVHAHGPAGCVIPTQRAQLALPGALRPTKLWDLLVLRHGRLVAAIEFKSHVGPSFGNNFNNRAEEAIGSALDLRLACRDGLLGAGAAPFVGWLMLVEEAPGSTRPLREASPHFALAPDIAGSSYLERYEHLCRRLMDEGLYTATALLASSRETGPDGAFRALSPATSLEAFASALAAHLEAQKT